ncbi:UDP-glucose--hexose-1-phosphate uridylyltransferase [bacterium]|nr:MAG: UDP-glucose--hexose-1-phosphate uridylyltransferase [bacterium]
MSVPDFEQIPHRRYNPLIGEWVLVSPHRTLRPWQGAQEEVGGERRPEYDPTCYLCPGNDRAGGAENPPYEGTFVFRNDYSAMLSDTPEAKTGTGLLRAETVRGECRVVCFSPRHDLSLAEMEIADIERVVQTWADQTAELGEKYRWVQVFENKGAAMGCSNPHPHGQIWCSSFLPSLPAREDEAQRTYFAEHGRPLLLDCLGEERQDGRRIVAENEHWTLLVPFWATWPFEYLLVPRRHVARFPDLTGDEKAALAEILKDGLGRYDRLFQTSFPYTMGWHGAPFDDSDTAPWQLHAHFYPPLLRSATVRKFMVGYEMLAEAQRDLTAELAASRLRDA